MTFFRHCLPALLTAFALLPSLGAAQQWRPGLVARYRDAQGDISLLTPTVDIRLSAEQSVHPQVAPAFEAEWSGLLRIDRAGKYRLMSSARIELLGEPAGDEMVQLATGEHPLRLRYERPAGDATVTLRWESEFFDEEPVPTSVLGHEEAGQDRAGQEAVERGRLLFAELGCGNCHAAANWRLQHRQGPDLSHIAARVKPGWIYQWLGNPHAYRPGAVMPVCLDTKQQRADVAAFLGTLGKAAPTGLGGVARGKDLAVLSLGASTFRQVGCEKCHDAQNTLQNVQAKYATAEALASYIAQPHRTDPGGRMPQFFDTDEQHLAAAVAAHLYSQPAAESDPPPAGDASRGAELYVTRGCHRCHAANSGLLADHLKNAPPAPAFGRPKGLPLKRLWSFDNRQAVEQQSGAADAIRGEAAWSTGRVAAGDDATSFQFNGRTFIEANHFPRPGTMTITVWVKTEQGGSIVTWGRPGGGLRGSREFRMNIGQDGKNSLCYGEYNSDGGWRPVVVKPSVNLIDGQWHHLALVRQNDRVQHYVDGQPVGRPGRSQPTGGDYTDRLLIGALGLQANPSNRFRGEMDELAIWETALAPAQIASLADAQPTADLAAPPEQDFEAFDPGMGCLAEEAPPQVPHYRLPPEDRTALQALLRTVQTADGPADYHESPRVQRDLLIQQFRCTACHQLDDKNVQRARRVTEDGEVVAVERPPLLTGVGHKLTVERLRGVLLRRERNRPWLGLRMPHFGPAVAQLPEWFAACAGLGSETEPPPNRDLASAGLALIGKQRGKAACIACHNYRGINRRRDGVTPAPDLAEAGRTIRTGWFLRWMHDPQRLQPGTSMPQFFLDLSPEQREQSIAQLWSAIYYQDELPLPAGVLDRKTEGTRIVVQDQPVVFRMATKTPVGQIDRAINVGVPGGLNYTFDPVECRLRYVWRGSFIDAAPAWNGRGGNPVSAGDDAAVAFPNGNSLTIDALDTPPRFLGYRMVDQLPVFRYRISDATIEQHILLSPKQLTQRFVVKGANDEIVYAGGPARCTIKHAGRTIPSSGEPVRLPAADEVTFEVTTLLP